ncbi:hypothetical protein E2C01_023312 [Portunus trituberculatus]|uniref:Uncharacterized protein n=1 Tax=Portunus trituberculatus TaxID=210409 RepID=A0A5B7E9G9_PORTR|nr:hypothetical protein [Portunus trituberculatus]
MEEYAAIVDRVHEAHAVVVTAESRCDLPLAPVSRSTENRFASVEACLRLLKAIFARSSAPTNAGYVFTTGVSEMWCAIVDHRVLGPAKETGRTGATNTIARPSLSSSSLLRPVSPPPCIRLVSTGCAACPGPHGTLPHRPYRPGWPLPSCRGLRYLLTWVDRTTRWVGPWTGFKPVRLETPRTPKHAWFHCTTAGSWLIRCTGAWGTRPGLPTCDAAGNGKSPAHSSSSTSLPPTRFPADLCDAATIFLRNGITTGPLQPPCTGLYRVLHRNKGQGEDDSPATCSACIRRLAPPTPPTFRGAALASPAAPSVRGGALAPSTPNGGGTTLPSAPGRHC